MCILESNDARAHSAKSEPSHVQPAKQTKPTPRLSLHSLSQVRFWESNDTRAQSAKSEPSHVHPGKVMTPGPSLQSLSQVMYTQPNIKMDKRGTKSTRLAQSKQNLINREEEEPSFPCRKRSKPNQRRRRLGRKLPPKLRIEPQRGIALSQQTNAGRPIAQA
jgi:hypothetical protein